jgi:DNA-binding transcriptional MerR regulator
MIDEHYRIGEVADSVGLSLRTIRYYEEVGLVTPSGRTEGGFRLYTDSDVDRLRLVKAVKPVGMSLETMGELLEAADQVAGSPDSDHSEAESRLDAVLAVAIEQCDQLEERLVEARRALSEISGRPTRRKR